MDKGHPNLDVNTRVGIVGRKVIIDQRGHKGVATAPVNEAGALQQYKAGSCYCLRKGPKKKPKSLMIWAVWISYLVIGFSKYRQECFETSLCDVKKLEVFPGADKRRDAFRGKGGSFSWY